MPNDMLVSIVIPACDAQAYLPRAVKSALAQTHRDTEVIVVADDGFDYAAFLGAKGISLSGQRGHLDR